MSTLGVMDETGKTAEQPIWDIVIAGAGMAGLYFTWRLLKYGRKIAQPKILILEMLNRVGGRLDTDIVNINGDLVKNEEGGMRFTTGMKNLMWLLGQLDLKREIMPFSMGDDHNIYNLRTKKITFGETTNDPAIWSQIYNLTEKEKNRQPNAILQDVFNAILIENHRDPKQWYPSTPEEWQEVRLDFTYRNIELYKWGFWALLVDYGISQECMQMIEDSMGFLAFYDQKVNAGVGFQTMGDFDKLPDYLTLVPGYSTLAESVADQVQAMGGTITLGQRVDSFDLDHGDPDVLSVLSQGQDGLVHRYRCRQLVLALPKLPLARLAPYCPLLRDNAQVVSNINSVVTMPLTKINLYFDERWWFNRYQVSAGGSFTDLPMGQFYCYWPIVSDDTRGPASMTIYCDFDRTTYWEELQDIGTPFEPTGVAQPKNTTAASTYVVEQAMRQLRLFFQDDNLPIPVLSTYVRWGTASFGDGDHSWVTGANDRVIMKQLLNPVAGKVYICGEAYSDDQAWVNGALRSCESLLQGYFDIPPLDL